MNAKYEYGTEENKAYLKASFEDLLRFGRQFPSPEGGSYYLGDDGTPWIERARETWITARMAHVYSLATILGYGNVAQLPDVNGNRKEDAAPAMAAELAEKAIRGLAGELHDTVNGGWFSGIQADGTPLPNKLCYQHAFVILAATSGKLAGVPGAEELLQEAKAAYDRYFWNEAEGLSCDTWNTEFTALDPYRGLNANMHTVEAFLAVADTENDEKYRVRAGRIIDRVISWAKGQSWRIPEHFSSEWVADLDCNRDHPNDPFKPYGATPGHGIEWARLITQWALSTYPMDAESAKPYLDAAQNLFRRAVEDAWNADGAPGIAYTTDWEGHPVVHDRMHWTLMEGINTSAVLYQVTGEAYYASCYSQFMQYMDECVQDHVNGSFFHQLDAQNQVIGTVWPGKSDLYHAAQAMLIPYADASISIAKGLKEENC